MADATGRLSILWKAAAVVLALVLGIGAAPLLGRCDAYHHQAHPSYSDASVCRAEVDCVLDEKDGLLDVKARILSGGHRGSVVRTTQPVSYMNERGRLAVGDRCLLVVRDVDGELHAVVASRERDGFLLGMAAALVVLLAVTAGRKGLAAATCVAWAVLLLTGMLLPAVVEGASAALWCIPLALAISLPALPAIGGFNRKSLSAIAGTLCGVVTGGVLAYGLTVAMHLTGLELDFGPRAHLDNRLWFAEPLHNVDFASLLVAGMLIAGLGAVMDVSMAVASTVAEVRRMTPSAGRGELFRGGLAAGRDIIGIMVLTLAMVYVGSHLMMFVSLQPTGWSDNWILLANFEEIAGELVRLAAAAVGMAVCVPAGAAAAALHYAGRPAEEDAVS